MIEATLSQSPKLCFYKYTVDSSHVLSIHGHLHRRAFSMCKSSHIDSLLPFLFIHRQYSACSVEFLARLIQYVHLKIYPQPRIRGQEVLKTPAGGRPSLTRQPQILGLVVRGRLRGHADECLRCRALVPFVLGIE